MVASWQQIRIHRWDVHCHSSCFPKPSIIGLPAVNTCYTENVNTYITFGNNSVFYFVTDTREKVIYDAQSSYVTIQKTIWRPCFMSNFLFSITLPIYVYRSVVYPYANSTALRVLYDNVTLSHLGLICAG